MADRDRDDGNGRDPLGELLAGGASRSFGPGFADRVVARVRDPHAGRDVQLVDQFRWLAAAASLAAILLAAYSLFGVDPRADQSALEAVLGLDPVSVESLVRVGVPGIVESAGGGSP